MMRAAVSEALVAVDQVGRAAVDLVALVAVISEALVAVISEVLVAVETLQETQMLGTTRRCHFLDLMVRIPGFGRISAWIISGFSTLILRSGWYQRRCIWMVMQLCGSRRID
jgi:hypothetical protein